MSVIALDLGSTRVKAARVEAGARLAEFAARDAPVARASVEPGGVGRVEFDARELERAALEVLAELGPRAGERLAIASQRSTFLLFERASGVPATPAVSWQDRGAEPWIRARLADDRGFARRVRALTGLELSAHYAGPKLARLFEERPELAARARAGELVFGTLDAWLVHRMSRAARFAIDESQAARTLLLDPRGGTWSAELCAAFGVPELALPRVVASARDTAQVELVEGPAAGLRLAATIADQSAGALFTVGGESGAALVNFGTGTFVLAPTGARFPEQAGYLSSLLASRELGAARARSYAIEGTINAGARLFAEARPALAGTSVAAGESRGLPAGAFVLVDEHGIGAPHWRAELGPVVSAGAATASPRTRAALAFEGLCFRVRAILDDLATRLALDPEELRIVVAGGPAHDARLAVQVATLSGRPLELGLEPEATLLGAAALAEESERAEDRAVGTASANSEGTNTPAARTRRVEPDPDSVRDFVDPSAIASRYADWRAWVAATLGAPRDA